GGGGADTMTGGAGDDIYITDGGDTITEAANEGTDTVQSSVTLTLGTNLETLILTGTAAINGTGNAGANTLTGNAAANLLAGGDGNDTLSGGAGNDTLDGGTGVDALIGGAGDDLYVVDAAGDGVTEALNEGTDTVQSAVTYVLGANLENLTLTGAAAINGTGNTGANALIGNAAANLLSGGDGSDTLNGGAGDDTLDGGAGADRLDGGTGNNTYRFGRGDGADVIQSYDPTATKRNVLELKAGVAQADLSGVRFGEGLVLSIAGTADSVTLYGYFSSYTGWRPVQEVRLSTGVVLSVDAFIPLNYAGSGTADRIEGSERGNAMTGLAGADTLYGYGGNDTLDGGADNDQLYGGEGSDSLTGGLGDDQLYGDLHGEVGDDTLDGGAGVDQLNGGAGNNTYRFGRGDGADVIAAVDWTVAKRNVLELKAGVALADLRAIRLGNDLVLSIAGTADSVTLGGYYFSDGWRPVQEVRLSTGDVVNVDAVARLNFSGTALADTMDGTVLADVMTGLAGNDRLNGNGGNDSLDGGADNDWLLGGDGNDSLTGGLGDDTLQADAGDDTLDGGAGSDTLDGGAGNNTYRFGRGDGADVIQAVDPTAAKKNVLELKAGVALADLRGARVGTDLVLSIAGTSDSVTLQGYFYSEQRWHPIQEVRLSDGALVSVDGLIPLNYIGSAAAERIDGSEMGNVVSGLEGEDTLRGYGSNDTLDGGADNDLMDGDDGNDSLIGGLGNDSVYGGAGDDILLGGEGRDFMFSGSGNDRLDGGDGNDQLGGNDGNDSLIGGLGNDYLYGGSGQDTYYFGRGDGRDYIKDSGTDGAIDTVQFLAGTSLTDLTISRWGGDGTDLMVSRSALDRIVLGGRLVDVNGGADRLRFADGKSLTVEVLVQAMAAFGSPSWAAGGLSLARADVQQYLTPYLASGP
ncbi:MAG: hypothetical protein IOC85_12875, partial [Rhodobacter sp.]|nr:hypothetical protein [Rhodobacter sp.]